MNAHGRQRSKWLEFLTGPRPAIRTVEVTPPSHSDEAAGVFLTAAFVCLCVIYILAFQLYGAAGSTADARANALLPYQVLFRDLPSQEQRVFRSMQEGLQEALRVWTASRAWPAVDVLAEQEVPPFARDVLDKSALSWTQTTDGPTTAYVGVPAAAGGMPAFMILIQEPPPTGGEQALPSVIDEEHQVIADGTLLHVTYWKRPRELPRATQTSDPALDGWSQIRLRSRLEETEGQ